MQKIIFLSFFLIISIFSANIYGEEITASEIPTVSLDECLKSALANNPKLRQAVGAVDINRAKVSVARSDYLPKATTTVSYAHATDTAGFVAAGGLAVKGNTYATQTGLEQLIWDFGQTLNQIKLAKENLTSAQLSFLQTQEDIIYKTKQAYFEVLKGQLLLEVAGKNLEQSKIHLEQMKGFYEVGLKQKFDITQAEANLSKAKLDKVKSNKNYQVAKVTLNNIMGRKAGADYKVQEIEKFNPIEIGDMDKILQDSIKSRPEILKLEAETRAARANLEINKKGNWPKVNMDASHGIRDTQTSGTVDSFNLGVLLKWPWFDSFKTQSQVKEAQASLDVAGSKIQEETLAVLLEVQDAAFNLEEAKEGVAAEEKLWQEAEENLEIQDNKYKEGLSSVIDAGDARLSLLSAKKNYVVSICDYLISLAKYEKATGVISQPK